MKNIENIIVLGAGAIGAAYASRLYDVEPGSIKILADRERIDRYKNCGFTINGKQYTFDYITPESCRSADLIILAVKFYDLEGSLRLMERCVGENTIILSLLNGISSEEIIGKYYGMEKVLYSICIGIDAVREGSCIDFSSMGRIFFGESRNEFYSEKVHAVKNLFDKCSIPYVIPADMLKVMWWKFMVNVSINQTSAVLKAPYGVFQKVKEARELMDSAAREVIELSKALKIDLNEEDLEEWHRILDSLWQNSKTSMLQDIEAGRKTEVDIFGGVVCELGKKYNIATPVNDILVKMIHILEKANLK